MNPQPTNGTMKVAFHSLVKAGAAFTIQGNDLVVVNGEIKPGLRTAETHQR